MLPAVVSKQIHLERHSSMAQKQQKCSEGGSSSWQGASVGSGDSQEHSSVEVEKGEIKEAMNLGIAIKTI